MAVAVELRLKGATTQDYDRVLAALGYSPGGEGAPGGLFHWVMPTNDGLRIIDVWRDLETFERFAQEKIAPAMQQAGVPSQPEITTYPVHNYLFGPR